MTISARRDCASFREACRHFVVQAPAARSTAPARRSSRPSGRRRRESSPPDGRRRARHARATTRRVGSRGKRPLRSFQSPAARGRRPPLPTGCAPCRAARSRDARAACGRFRPCRGATRDRPRPSRDHSDTGVAQPAQRAAVDHPVGLAVAEHDAEVVVDVAHVALRIGAVVLQVFARLDAFEAVAGEASRRFRDRLLAVVAARSGAAGEMGAAGACAATLT